MRLILWLMISLAFIYCAAGKGMNSDPCQIYKSQWVLFCSYWICITFVSNFHVIDDTAEKYYVEGGCRRQGEGSFQPKSYKARVRCCSNDGKSCDSPLDCNNHQMSFDKAVEKCKETGRRLCTKAELLSKVCCSTGGGCDDFLIWTSTGKPGETDR